MVKQSRVVTGSDLALEKAATVLKAQPARTASAASGWKKLGRASGVFTVGLLAAVAAPRDAKAVGYFADNSGVSNPPIGVTCPEQGATGCYTSWMVLADLNNDGFMDQLWANGGGYYVPGTVNESTILLNNGVGVFTDVTPTAFGAATSRLRQESVADVNGDGLLDIYQPGGFGLDLDKLWIQTSTGVFVNEAATLLPAGLMSHAGSSHMGDLDGDGDIDILVMDWGIGGTTVDHAIVYFNDGTGKFTFGGMQNDPAFASATDMLPASIPSSGNAPPGSTAANYTLATATASTGSITYWGTRPIDVDLVDVDNDFDLDIMVDHRNGYSRIFLNDGKGHFTDGTNWKLTNSTDGQSQTVTTNWPLKRGPYVYNQEFCDIDEDGDMDMLLDNVGPKPVNNQSWAPGGGTGGTIDVTQLSINDGHGKFTDDTVNRIIGELGGDDNAVKCADFNGDGHYDLVTATLSGRSEKFLLNDGTAHFTMIGDAIPVVTDSSLTVEAADLNGDKIMDLTTGSGESRSPWVNRVYLGGGPSVADHTPPAFRAIQTPVPFAETPTVIRFALRDAATSETGQMVKSAAVNYSISGGASKIVKAVWYGGDLFRGTIPAQPAGTTVTVTLSAVDRAGITGTSTPFTYVVPTIGTMGMGGSGGTANVAGGAGTDVGGGGTAAGGTAAGGAAGAPEEVAGAAGEPTEIGGTGGTAGKASGGTGGKATTSKAGAASTSGGETGSEAGETGTAGTGSHPVSSDDGGCAISASTPARKGTGAVMLGFGLAMLGLVRRRRNRK